MLTDVLGIIIGFVTIVLLLSILVTGVVQTIVSFIRKRHAALVHGIAESGIEHALKSVIERSGIVEAGKSTDKKEKATNEGALLELVTAAVNRAKTDKRVTWLEDKEIIEPLKAAGIAESGIAVVKNVLDHTRQVMDTKYLQWARGLTFAAAVLVAILFGASVPNIMHRLWNDPELAKQAAALGEKMDKGAPDATEQKALTKKILEQSRTDLGNLGLKPLENVKFYWEDVEDPATKTSRRVYHLENMAGVLFMAVLLSFGAPFWYRVLKELIGLKDAIRKKEGKPPDEEQTADDAADKKKKKGATA